MVEVQEIMNKYGKEYKEKHKMMGYKLRTMEAIEKCRTAELGAHEDVCDNCGYKKISYNSCRNRHCPKCQSVAREKWIYNREYDLLNVKYFHVVMTIPEELYIIAYQNQTKVYNILFKAVGETQNAIDVEQTLASGRIEINGVWYDNIDAYLKNEPSKNQEINFEEVFETAEKHPQQTKTNDIGIVEDGSVVNLDLWTYYLFGSNNNEYTLGKTEESGQPISVGYKNENITSDGKIQGKVPMFIVEPETYQFMILRGMNGTFANCVDLKTAPEIPASVQGLEGTFGMCNNLTGTLKINSTELKIIENCLYEAATEDGCALELIPHHSRYNSLMESILSTATSDNVTIKQ